MRSFICIMSIVFLFLNTHLYSKTWTQYPSVPDFSGMTEHGKADYWLADRGEVSFAVYPASPMDLKPLVDVIYINQVEAGRVTAVADRKGFGEFLTYGFEYEVLTPEWMTGPVPMSDYAEYLAGKAPADWYTYPSYGAYVGFLNKWAQDYSSICKLYVLGPSGEASLNHRIYAMRVSDNAGVSEAEPKYLETNTIHGDEVLNMMNCLHMLDTVLSSYGKIDRFTRLVDSLEMWFVPNMNPDGTYPRGDNTVEYAQRLNVADDFDLNRNNPCPCGQGTHKLYGLYTYYSKETQALMLLHSWYKFPFAQDQHGGTETYLWPYGGIDARPKDEDWYKALCKKLVDQIHIDCNNNGYMTSCGGDGIGNIRWELYECHGIRADMNDWVGNGKSITLESSIEKKLPPAKLKEHWMWCKEALIMSYENLYKTGLHGIVTDSITGKPLLKVEITRNGDTLNSLVNGMVLTDSCGKYVKYMNKGTYTLKFKKDGYIPKLIPNFSVTSYDQRTNLNVRLSPNDPQNILNDFLGARHAITITPYKKGIKISSDDLNKNMKVGIYTMNGRLIKMAPVVYASIVWDGNENNGTAVNNGCYIINILRNNQHVSKSFILNR